MPRDYGFWYIMTCTLCADKICKPVLLQSGSAEEFTGFHAAFTGGLQRQDFYRAVGGSEVEVSVVGVNFALLFSRCGRRCRFCFEYLGGDCGAVGECDVNPGAG